MDRHSIDWHGYIPAITTPFDTHGTVDINAWREQLRWMTAQRMHGIIVAGTTGEWFSLEDDERATLFRTAVEEAGDAMTVIGCCNALTPARAIAHARAAADAGMDGILLSLPPYVVPAPAEQTAFYRAVSDAVPIPLCVYNWPRGTGVDMSPDTLREICALEHVVALKNSTPDFGAFVTGLTELSGTVRYFGIPTNETGIRLLRGVGGDGLMGAGAVLGSDHPDFFRAVDDGDLDRARTLGARDRILMESWFSRDYGARFASAPAILKHALRRRGVPAGHVRAPLLPLTAAEERRVDHTLEELGLIPA
ncbi:MULTISPECIES: dihydrodipicolinate synthase family protein [unclassified Streptomyces]|uniref:dihydrodipicolinate synthase family protein n=1 Tax=unclassified Streptomyces TaxID=2593676 RepID=UPI002237EE26|nr:dihydrodipicolinate synthase family protein [Streptomyces sp. SHP 1-2]MCW5254496.1 dihydrodipicolinate synthase family protein [Streptomyces sp. SHP 1-2]